MLQDFIKNKLSAYIPHTPTTDQRNVIHAIAQFIQSNDDIFVLTGYAGTGKTTLIQSIVKTLEDCNIPSVQLAPTGRAAKVLCNYTQKTASTIHKKIYKQTIIGGFPKFQLHYNNTPKAVFIVDEASMLANQTGEQSIFGSGLLFHDLIDFVFTKTHCKLILVGDTAQLAPIGLNTSPALDVQYIQHTFLKTCHKAQLQEVVRQAEESGILQNATRIRTHIDNNSIHFPKLTTTYNDTIAIQGADLLEHLEKSYNTKGIENTIVITRSNKLANRYNQGIRQNILWRDSEICAGDYIMIVKNNYYWTQHIPEIDFLANGDIVKIVAVKKYETLYNINFAQVIIECPDYNNIQFETKVILNTLHSESPSFTKDEQQAFFDEVIQDYADIQSKKKKYEELKKNEYFQALQIKFAYAVTCHKAQGGQWNDVYIDHGYLTENMMNLDFLRWLYTAITRATDTVFLIHFDDKFFDTSTQKKKQKK